MSYRAILQRVRCVEIYIDTELFQATELQSYEKLFGAGTVEYSSRATNPQMLQSDTELQSCRRCLLSGDICIVCRS